MTKHIRIKLDNETHAKFKSGVARNNSNMQKVILSYINDYLGVTNDK